MTKKAKPTGNTKLKRIALILILATVGIFILGAIGRGSKTGDENESQEPDKAADEGMTQQLAEEVCQDEAIIKTASLSDKITVVTLSYNPYYSDNQGYDVDGNKIVSLTWSGKNKTTDKEVSFTCIVGGKNKDDAKIYYLAMGGVTLLGSLDYDSYRQDGTKIE